ncbi:MAG: hypothetical protein IKY44_02805 [Clostridia bacterium]|nr:hypothetical protein [Clostridia bacterium]
MRVVNTSRVVKGVLKYLSNPKDGKYGKVHYPVFFVIIGLIGVAIFGTISLITAFSDEPLWLTVEFLAIAALALIPIIMFINCRIVYDEDGFVARNFLGIRRYFKFSQVTSITETTKKDYIVYIGNKRVLVDAFAEGNGKFISYVKRKYAVTHNGKIVPLHKKETKW